MTNYPKQIDNSISLPPAVDNLTPVQGIVVNRLRDAIISIESALGTNPNIPYTTVAARLGTLENTLGNLSIINLAGDLGGTLALPKVVGIQGRPISSVLPNLGDALVWGGSAWMPLPVSGGGGGGIAGGDLSGMYPSPKVVKIQGNSISNAALGLTEDGYILTWTNSLSEWQAKIAPVGFSAGGDLTGTAINQQVISLTGVAGTLSAASTAANIQWSADTIGLQLSQLGATTDITPSDFTIIPQAPFAGATTAAHKTPGRVVIKFPTAIAGGNDSSFVLNYNSVDYYTINPHPAAPGTSITTPTGHILQMSSGPHGSIILGPSYTQIQTAFGGTLRFQWNTAANFGWVDATSWRISDNTADTTAGALYQFDFSTTSKIHFGVRATSATIKYDDDATNGITGKVLTIQGQSTTGTTSTGGDLVLQSGAGTSASGSITLKSGISNVFTSSYINTYVLGSNIYIGANGYGLNTNQVDGHTNLTFNYTPTLTVISATEMDIGVPTLSVASTMTSFTLSQATHATVAHPMTIQAANVTTGTGSDLILTSGTGSAASGSVIFKAGSTTVATASSAKLISNIGRRVITTNTTTNINVTDADEIIVVGVLGAGITVTLPATPTAGDIYTIKDQAGGAAIHNIIIDGNGHNIDGVATYTMSVNFQSVDIVFANSTWCII